MNKILFVAIAVFLGGGCAFLGGDGPVAVSQQEARAIAQKELGRVGQERVFAVAKPRVQDDGVNWKVVFPVSSRNVFSPQYFSYYIVELDKISGNISRSETTEALSDLFQE